MMMTEHVLHDVRFALRTIRRNLRFTAVVVLTLAVAIGMNTAIFSVFNAVVMRPLGYPHAERLVWLSTVGTESDSGLVTGPDFIDWRNQSLSFDRMAAYATGDLRLLSATGAARINSAAVTEDFWTMTGALPATGRLPGPGERDVVLASHDFARRWLAGDSPAVGRTVTLDDRQVTIVGGTCLNPSGSIFPARFRQAFGQATSSCISRWTCRPDAVARFSCSTSLPA